MLFSNHVSAPEVYNAISLSVLIFFFIKKRQLLSNDKNDEKQIDFGEQVQINKETAIYDG
jgi:hypothetical protein